MHIHKPKAAHSLGEFLSEIGVIVVGILIALTGEQAIEALHWRHVAERAELDLDKEVRQDLTYAAERLSYQECLKGRLAELRDRLTSAGGAWKADPMVLRLPIAHGPHEVAPGHVLPIVHGLPFFSFTHEAWDAARASGALGHMPAEKLGFYAAFYEKVDRLNGWQAAESAAAVRLAPLGYATQLDRRDRDARLADLAAIDANAFYVDSFSRLILEEGRTQGMHPDSSDLARFVDDARQISGACIRKVGA